MKRGVRQGCCLQPPSPHIPGIRHAGVHHKGVIELESMLAGCPRCTEVNSACNPLPVAGNVVYCFGVRFSYFLKNILFQLSYAGIVKIRKLNIKGGGGKVSSLSPEYYKKLINDSLHKLVYAP